MDRLTGYIVTAAVVATAVTIVFFMKTDPDKGDKMTDESYLNAAFLKYQPASSYDPIKIQFSPEYVFLENIYSPLLENNAEGEIVSGIAERYEWVGPELHFRLRQNLKTIDGRPIDARDVERSFKRVLLLRGGTHTDLADAVCPGVTLKKIDDFCPGMEVRENNRLFVVKLAKKNASILKMFTSMDLAVIPSGSIDPETFAISDYRNTSGPYYVERDDAEGRILLAANPAHYHYSPKIPQKVRLVPAGKNGARESVELFSQGKVDYIMSCDKAGPEILTSYAAERPEEVRLHSTAPFHLHMIAFTRKGISRFNGNERFKIGTAFKRIYLDRALKTPGTEEASQIIPAFGTETLTDAQKASLNGLFQQAGPDEVFPQKILAWNLSMADLFKNEEAVLRRIFPNTRIEIGRSVPALTDFGKSGSEEPDLIFVTIDMGFQESIGRMSYMTNVGLFYAPGMDAKKWVSEYVAIEDKAERISKARKLHYDTLAHACAVPMMWAPYTAIVRKPWQTAFSKIYPDSHLWRIYRN
jgi:hypothetical protein